MLIHFWQINLPPPGGIRFRVAINLDSTTQSTFVVTCSESSSMHATILQHINNIARNCNPDVLLVSSPSHFELRLTMLGHPGLLRKLPENPLFSM